MQTGQSQKDGQLGRQFENGGLSQADVLAKVLGYGIRLAVRQQQAIDGLKINSQVNFMPKSGKIPIFMNKIRF